jgi:toxin FitB
LILLDTNIISEGLRPRPDAKVRDWIDSQSPADLYICTPVLAELRYGVELLPDRVRRARLELAIRKTEEAFGSRVLPFDRAAAYEYGRILAHRDRLGCTSGAMDGLIAAIAKVHGASVATRDERGFTDIGLDIINPFDQASP